MRFFVVLRAFLGAIGAEICSTCSSCTTFRYFSSWLFGWKVCRRGKDGDFGKFVQKMIAILQELTVFGIIMVLFGKKLVDFLAFPYKILYICSKIRIASFLPLRVC